MQNYSESRDHFWQSSWWSTYLTFFWIIYKFQRKLEIHGKLGENYHEILPEHLKGWYLFLAIILLIFLAVKVYKGVCSRIHEGITGRILVPFLEGLPRAEENCLWAFPKVASADFQVDAVKTNDESSVWILTKFSEEFYVKHHAAFPIGCIAGYLIEFMEKFLYKFQKKLRNISRKYL